MIRLVGARVTYLELRYRYETLYRQLETLLGCALIDLEHAR